MTSNTIAATAKNAATFAIACALTLGSVCAPALAATTPPEAPAVVAQSGRISEGEAVFAARSHLGIAAEDVEDLDVDLETYGGRLCYEVEIETWASDVSHHVMVDAYDGTVHGYWVDD